MHRHTSTDWLYAARGPANRIEAYFSGAAYTPHRHDTYTIGITLQGVQSFNYRGQTRHSLEGGAVILHPDELHDGWPGTDAGFRYRAIYLEPSLIQTVLPGKPLPFIEGGVSTDARLMEAIRPLLADYDRPLEALEYQDAVYDLAVRLNQLGGKPDSGKGHNFAAAEMARQYIHERLDDGLSLDDLETLTGYNRWQLSRDFRALFGASPYRYLLMRRLDNAREALLAGAAIANAASASGFADQSHFTRQFKKAYGLTPKKWVNAVNAATLQ